jgi:hypothetical protein
MVERLLAKAAPTAKSTQRRAAEAQRLRHNITQRVDLGRVSWKNKLFPRNKFARKCVDG